MDIEKLKKTARMFQSATSTPTSVNSTEVSVSAPKRVVHARINPMTAAQEKLYGSLTADKGFSLADARRRFLSGEKTSDSKD